MAEYRAAADRVASGRHQRVLDWGCGRGQLTHLLNERGVRVDSLDYDPDADGVEVRPLERYPGLEADFTNDPVTLPFEDDTFDAVLSMGVLEHVADPEASLDEIARIAKPGSPLYVYKLPNTASYLEAIARRTGGYYHGQLPDDRLYTLDSARALLERHGYQVLELRYANMLPLTLPGRAATKLAPAIWGANRALATVPGLHRLATNVELIARVPSR